jgi:hypothetical protein
VVVPHGTGPIALLYSPDPEFVKEASKRGVFAHISDADVEDWQSSIDENGAFEMLAEHSWIANRKLIDPAAAVVDATGCSRSTHRRLPSA